jgi:hypothetical protein
MEVPAARARWRQRLGQLQFELGGGDDHDGGVPGAPCALWAPRWGAAARTTTPPFSTRAGATASSTATTLLLDAGAVGGVSSSPPPPSCYRCATTTNGVGPAPRPFAEARYPATFPGVFFLLRILSGGGWVPLLVLSRRPATPPHSEGTGSSRSVVRVFFFCVYFQEAGSVPGADSLGLSALVVP